jgi:hypothetical protein
MVASIPADAADAGTAGVLQQAMGPAIQQHLGGTVRSTDPCCWTAGTSWAAAVLDCWAGLLGSKIVSPDQQIAAVLELLECWSAAAGVLECCCCGGACSLLQGALRL